jgi:hypothetical protein
MNANTREPLPLEQLLTPDQRRLSVALGADQPSPWPESLTDNIRETARRIEAEAAARAQQ